MNRQTPNIEIERLRRRIIPHLIEDPEADLSTIIIDHARSAADAFFATLDEEQRKALLVEQAGLLEAEIARAEDEAATEYEDERESFAATMRAVTASRRVTVAAEYRVSAKMESSARPRAMAMQILIEEAQRQCVAEEKRLRAIAQSGHGRLDLLRIMEQ